MLTPEQRKQFNEIFEELGKSLDITQAQYEAAVTSYQFVGSWLSEDGSPLSQYQPEILPQGSFLLGTMVRPFYKDDFDVDLVCRLLGKRPEWTQADLKQIVGDRLKSHATLKKMLDKEGRRCWTLQHRESAKFHMDVLPSIVSKNFKILLEKSMSLEDLDTVGELAIRITDNHTSNYNYATNSGEWLKSNPFGYAAWFKLRSSIDLYKSIALNEAVQPVPEYQSEKLPLQRVVQILKRHRDIMFNGDKDKPISIIITTLAALSYSGQTDIIEALISVVNLMEDYIEERYDTRLNRFIKWVGNPVNNEENFADKWVEDVKKQDNFFKWLQQIKNDVRILCNQRGLHNIQEMLSGAFGKNDIQTVFSSIGNRARVIRESGGMKMAAGTGMLGSSGRTEVGYHNNFGNGK